jgi:hypothetical protein
MGLGYVWVAGCLVCTMVYFVFWVQFGIINLLECVLYSLCFSLMKSLFIKKKHKLTNYERFDHSMLPSPVIYLTLSL